MLLRAGRVFVEIERGTADVSLRVNCRVTHIWMFVKAFWQYNGSTQIDRHSPELAQQFAFDLNVLYPVRVFLRIDRRYGFVQCKLDVVSSRWIQPNLLYVAVEIPGRHGKKPTSHIPMDPESATIAALAFCI